ELYDPRRMPEELRGAHRALDRAVDRAYRLDPFATSRERIEHLFSRYERLIADHCGDQRLSLKGYNSM
ncbi:MAG: type IIL restriction-modification enzyme MmeI, partial [Bradymonadaceae bacterium]